ncbi:MAG: hypothetical protein AB8B69_23700 [Chitinophagales bacterium]
MLQEFTVIILSGGMFILCFENFLGTTSIGYFRGMVEVSDAFKASDTSYLSQNLVIFAP